MYKYLSGRTIGQLCNSNRLTFVELSIQLQCLMLCKNDGKTILTISPVSTFGNKVILDPSEIPCCNKFPSCNCLKTYQIRK